MTVPLQCYQLFSTPCEKTHMPNTGKVNSQRKKSQKYLSWVGLTSLTVSAKLSTQESPNSYCKAVVLFFMQGVKRGSTDDLHNQFQNKNVLTSSFYTMVWNFVIIDVRILDLFKKKSVLWRHSDFDPWSPNLICSFLSPNEKLCKFRERLEEK